ncbi:MAG TPA: type III-B CRISPR module-associated protein Cmr5 [Saprospiraceae bacterium]|nr:type III-B CRISPR module-associated protein Cmr5 [Saprospiraceae bacterium]
MSRQGIEQGRATAAYKYAEAGKKLGGGPKTKDGNKVEDSAEAKEYKSYTRKIPMMIKTNGLGSALAFVKSKQKKEAYKKIYDQLTEWLSVECNLTKSYFNEKSIDLVKDVIAMNSFQYRAVTIETLALMTWLRRFAEGLIQGEAEGDDL